MRPTDGSLQLVHLLSRRRGLKMLEGPTLGPEEDGIYQPFSGLHNYSENFYLSVATMSINFQQFFSNNSYSMCRNYV